MADDSPGTLVDAFKKTSQASVKNETRKAY